MQEELTFARALAREAGSIMLARFGMGLPHEMKEDDSPVTAADREIHALVTARIAEAYPEHGLLGEEGPAAAGSASVWVFDPIDGTKPYLRGIPTNVFALSLVTDGEPVLGVVYDPYLDRLYHAVKGAGAFLNDAPLRTSARTALEGSYIETDGHKAFKDLAFFDRARDAGVRFLSYSSTVYAHMLLAAGQLEGVVFPLDKPWDCAASKVIVEEAGGIATDLAGKPQRYDGSVNGFVCAANAAYHEQLLALIAPSL